MKYTRLTSLALSGAIALSLSAPAFAADAKPNVTDIAEPTVVELTSVVNVPTIALTVPTSGQIILNPYKLDYKYDPASTTETAKNDSVLSKPMHIVNSTKSPIDVNYVVTAAPEGTVKLVATAPTAATTAKEVLLQFKIEAVTDNTVETFDAATAAQNIAPTGSATDATLTSTAATAVTLAASDDTATGAKKAVLFGFAGTAAEKPTEAWTAEDAITGSIAFTFKPVAKTVTPPAGP